MRRPPCAACSAAVSSCAGARSSVACACTCAIAPRNREGGLQAHAVRTLSRNLRLERAQARYQDLGRGGKGAGRGV